MNIEIHTNSELLELDGEPGQFKAKLRQEARYIDLAKCTSCGECAKVCPVDLPSEYDEGLAFKKATYKSYAQAIPGAFAIQKADKAPCRLACPGGLNVQGYVQMVKEGKYKEALDIIMEDLPLPGVLGRICPHGCEDACRRCDVDDPVAIRDLKRLAADKFDPREIDIPRAESRPEKVAIIGSGPAGLSCAYHLARRGIGTTIFESLPEAGGKLRVGIPAHRLPREVLDNEIELITNLGVELKTNTALGEDVTIDGLLGDGYKAVYLALGAHKGIELGIPGEKANGVRQGVDFLREVNLTGTTEVGNKVGIIGGGNVAIDVARSAVRLGAKEVTIIYRRTRHEMPAWEEEIQAAELEGTELTYLAAPQEVLTQDGKVVGLRLIRMELSEPDSSGRKRPIPVPGSEYDIEIDQLIPAIGQRPDLSSLEDVTGLTFSRWGTTEVNSISYATELEGVFAGGDLQTGPWVAIGAIGAGKEAAESIHRYLDGVDLVEGREPVVNENPVYRPVPENEPVVARAKMPELAAADRVGNFNEVELGYEEAEGQAEAARCINCGYCCECEQCVGACLADAIDHSEQPKVDEIEVGSVVLCPGSRPYDPSKLENIYHYNTSPNVMTSLEFERILSASGPTMGHLVRPSDEKEPKKIAWLQCVGSRDNNQCGNGYCSSVCCMYALKDSMIAKEHADYDLECTIFNMDIRSFGKDYELYYQRAKDSGIRFVKSRVHSLDVIGETDDLNIRFVDDAGELHNEQFDMVVLSVGLEITADTVEAAKRLGIELNASNFVDTNPFTPVETSRDGVFACGVFQGPMDIPSSVTEASAAACAAGARLAEARNTLTRSLELPEQIDVEGQDARIGVFVCNCGVNISSVVDVKEVEEYAKSLPGVVYSTQNLFTCSQDSQEEMKEIIKEQGLNRVVVAACSPKTHEPIFRDTLEGCGLNKYLFEMANIRNQDSWVHANEKDEATTKAKDLVRMSVARAVTLNSLKEKEIPVNKRGLVIGGGVSGMNAALGLANQGYEVVLLEKEAELGGLANNLTATIEGAKIGDYLASLVPQVTGNDKIEVVTNALITGFSGFKGNFTTELLTGADIEPRKIEHGVVILATGAHEYKPEEFLYGQNDSIMTQLELARSMQQSDFKAPDQVVMIQCVGSRNDDHPNCSRVCCQTAIKNALHLKEENPDTDVYVLYRDIRTYGLLEEYYTEARKKGVMFFRFDQDDPPVVEAVNGGVQVTFNDHVLNRKLLVETDMLVLSAGMRASDTDELAGIVKVARTADNHFMEAHVKLRPVDMASDAVYVCGTAHSPKLLGESIAQAQAAAARAISFLSQDTITLSAVTAKVDTENCVKCLTCVRSCPFEVPVWNTAKGEIEINEALCRGCGVCTAVCPRQVIQLSFYEDDQITSKIDAFFEVEA